MDICSKLTAFKVDWSQRSHSGSVRLVVAAQSVQILWFVVHGDGDELVHVQSMRGRRRTNREGLNMTLQALNSLSRLVWINFRTCDRDPMWTPFKLCAYH
jgi:hypothetical protein